MRFFKLNAALLALIFSIVGGILGIVLLFFVVRIFGKFSEFGSPENFIGWFGLWLIDSPAYFLPKRFLSDAALIPAFLFQLWLTFFVGIVAVRKIYRNNNPRVLKIIISLLAIALVVSFVFLIYSHLWENSNWKDEVNSFATNQGYEKAKQDFQAGKLKKLVISGDHEEDKFSGTNDGPFEIWNPIYKSSWPYPWRYSVEMEVTGYNLGMQSKYRWSLTHTNNTKSSN
jgi:hypothetical protein